VTFVDSDGRLHTNQDGIAVIASCMGPEGRRGSVVFKFRTALRGILKRTSSSCRSATQTGKVSICYGCIMLVILKGTY